MTSISTQMQGVGPDMELYDKIIADLNSGKKNEIARFILNQRNWVMNQRSWTKDYVDGTPKQQYEDLVGFDQAKRLIRTYITAIYLLRDYANGGVANLKDDRNNAIMKHRGWYLRDFIFPPILKKMGESGDVDEFYRRFTQKSSPEYGVVQSILMASDFDSYIDKYDKNGFLPQHNYTRENYMQDLMAVFDNIVSGRSIVLMEPTTIDAFNRFGHFCCDKTKPEFKKEYIAKANAATVVVQKDWTVEKERLAALRQPKNYGGNGYARS